MKRELTVKILLVINTKKNVYHAHIAELLETELVTGKGYQVSRIDMGMGLPLHEKENAIRREQAQLIVTLDLAGFELRNTLECASYNVMSCRMAHLLLGQYQEYRQWLDEPMNFSMFFFGGEVLCKQIQQKHPLIEHVLPAEQLTGIHEEGACKALIELIVQETELEIDY